MQVDSPEAIRNIALAGHSDTGKTTLASAFLYTAGVANRLAKVEDGGTVTDFDPEEVERKISIGLAPCFVPWREHKVNLVDCPGYGIFFTETEAALRATAAVLLGGFRCPAQSSEVSGSICDGARSLPVADLVVADCAALDVSAPVPADNLAPTGDPDHLHQVLLRL